ncbi:MAG: histidine triad nucleotide-binding protein [Thermoanaerobacteraceae bacterium]|nr:histidine triad nucleotide-binding protein [Thermoanaerobacteraceae bacterium]
MLDCIFCKIINKEIPSSILYEDDDMVAFKDVNPQAPVHFLVVPKKHIENILSLGEEDYSLLEKIFKRINILVKELGIAENGFRVVNNCNQDGGQTVMHLHFHVLGGRFMQWPPG